MTATALDWSLERDLTAERLGQQRPERHSFTAERLGQQRPERHSFTAERTG